MLKSLILAFAANVITFPVYADTKGLRCYSQHLPPITVEITIDISVSSFRQTLGSGAGPSKVTNFSTTQLNTVAGAWPIGTFAGTNSKEIFGVLTVIGKTPAGEYDGIYTSSSTGKLLIQEMTCRTY